MMVDTAERQMQFLYALRQSGVTDRHVMGVMESIPRDMFLEGSFRDRGHEDVALPISCGQTISQPSIVGRMTQALNLGPRHKVLEIGAGSGYQAAILARLARRVYSVERHRDLARRARQRLEALELHNVTVLTGDGTRGLPVQAPFDRIVVTAAAEDPPGPLIDQLAVNGIMVLPVGQSDTVQQLIRIEKTPTGLEYTKLCDVRFVPLIEGIARDPADEPRHGS